jgi:hypothetical protein
VDLIDAEHHRSRRAARANSSAAVRGCGMNQPASIPPMLSPDLLEKVDAYWRTTN